VVQVYLDNAECQRGLSAPALLDVSFHGEAEVVHIEFNQQGLELAVVDALGRISIHNAAAGINRMAITAKRTPESPSQQEGILALQWLGGSCPVGLNFLTSDALLILYRFLVPLPIGKIRIGPTRSLDREQAMVLSTHTLVALVMPCFSSHVGGYSA